MPREAIVVPMEILKPYVQGKVYECLKHTYITLSVENMDNYIRDTMELVLPYLNGKEVLDARASDTQCSIAMSAYTDFKNYKQS